MKGRRTGLVLCALLCLTIFLMAGCGSVKVPETLSDSALSISGNGEVTAYLVETFDKEYYDLTELEQMVRAELKQFHQAQAKQSEEVIKLISLARLADDSDKIGLKLWFRDVESYQSYTGMELFYGTIAQAYQKGCDLDVKLSAVKDGSVIGEMELYENGTRKLLIAQERVRIYGPGKPLYVSMGATVNEDGSVVPAVDTEESVYIIMK